MVDEDFRKEFYGLIKEALENPMFKECQSCVFFVQGRVIEFMMSMFTEAVHRIDISAQIMEDFLVMFKEIEEALFKEKMRGPD